MLTWKAIDTVLSSAGCHECIDLSAITPGYINASFFSLKSIKVIEYELEGGLLSFDLQKLHGVFSYVFLIFFNIFCAQYIGEPL